MKETEYLRKLSVGRLFNLRYLATGDFENQDFIDPTLLYATNTGWYAGKYGLTIEQVQEDIRIFNAVWEPRRYFLDWSDQELYDMQSYLYCKRLNGEQRSDKDDGDVLVIWIILRQRGGYRSVMRRTMDGSGLENDTEARREVK